MSALSDPTIVEPIEPSATKHDAEEEFEEELVNAAVYVRNGHMGENSRIVARAPGRRG